MRNFLCDAENRKKSYLSYPQKIKHENFVFKSLKIKLFFLFSQRNFSVSATKKFLPRFSDSKDFLNLKNLKQNKKRVKNRRVIFLERTLLIKTKKKKIQNMKMILS